MKTRLRGSFATLVLVGIFTLMLTQWSYAEGTPNISEVNFDVGDGVITVTGTFNSITGAKNDIDTSKLIVTDGVNYVRLSTLKVDIVTELQFEIVLNKKDMGLISKFTLNEESIVYLITNDGWNGKLSESIGELINMHISNIPSADTASYDYTAGLLTVNGNIIDLIKNDKDVTPKLLTLTDYGNWSPIKNTSPIKYSASNKALIQLAEKDKLQLETWITQNGTIKLILGNGWNGPSSPGMTIDCTIINYFKPTVIVTTTSVTIGTAIKASSNKIGTLYLVAAGTTITSVEDLNILVANKTSIKVAVPKPNVAVSLSTKTLKVIATSTAVYNVWAVDKAGTISTHSIDIVVKGKLYK